MNPIIRFVVLTLSFALLSSPCWADNYADTKKMFTDAGISKMFQTAYGYALFPTIGKAGFVVGGAYGKGRVYEQNKYIGDTAMTQASIGFQLGGTGFSQVVFFQDKRALDEFTTGNFEFGAEAQATALTAAVGASANTAGGSAAASGGKNNAKIASSGYNKGIATYTITKGGLMYEASVGGQKFSFTRRVAGGKHLGQ
ncbi:lipid-binding SYLF domain-containing protein [Desulfogranum marinum]|uniref:lipid-binding SYLF domain-containing protein n=1 Tax=Desulfogranum marinum TaxID=453220 RepID=UPI0029C68C35|nr:lipid-binding SYLF domain-containing protein [Desulfogranum marinum]